MPKLKEMISSNCSSVCYGLAGDPVRIVADRGEILIVENIIGSRFPVRRELVDLDDAIKVNEAVQTPPVPKEEKKPAGTKVHSTKKKSNHTENKNQQSLF
jgi:hypothetical protein